MTQHSQITQDELEGIKEMIIQHWEKDDDIGLGDMPNLVDTVNGIVDQWVIDYNITVIDNPAQTD